MSSDVKTAQLRVDTELLEGLVKNESVFPTLLMNSKTVAPADSIAVVQRRVDAGNAFVQARAAYLAAAQANREAQAETKAFVTTLRTAIGVAYGDSPATLAQYGLAQPKKRTPLTVEQKIVAVARRASTRAVRKTMGPRAKAKLKGATPTSVTIEVTTPGAETAVKVVK
jgi:hypothetical protein